MERHGHDDEASLGRNIYSRVAARLGQEIVAGDYPPGTLLPTAAEMCARFSVSRTALREAYSILSAKSLDRRPAEDRHARAPEVGVEPARFRSARLASTGDAERAFHHELFVLRQMVEPAAAALAASLHSPATIDRIAEAYDRMERFKNGAGDLIGADLDFHMAILEASENRFLAALGGMIHTALEGTFRLSWMGAARIQDARLFQHEGIFEAIREGDAELARARMAELLRNSIEDVRKYLRQRDAGMGRRSEPGRAVSGAGGTKDEPQS